MKSQYNWKSWSENSCSTFKFHDTPYWTCSRRITKRRKRRLCTSSLNHYMSRSNRSYGSCRSTTHRRGRAGGVHNGSFKTPNSPPAAHLQEATTSYRVSGGHVLNWRRPTRASPAEGCHLRQEGQQQLAVQSELQLQLRKQLQVRPSTALQPSQPLRPDLLNLAPTARHPTAHSRACSA